MSQDHLFALPKGQELGGYRMAEVLGSGGYGITYKAEEIALNRVVAIKEYLPNTFARRAADGTVRPRESKQQELFNWGIDRFRQEAETLVSLRHPNIVRVLRYFAANGTAYIVMVYERGASLGQRLRGAATFSAAELEALVEPLLSGVETVHKAGFLHRDIKPDNIYIRDDGSPVLLDFGAARQAIGARTQSITSIVSPGYSPFEQYGKAAGDQGPWTDIYALGATLYRCVTGERPPAALDRIGGKALMPLAAEIGKGRYPPAVLAAIDAALAMRAEDRPQNIAEWRALLKGKAPRGAPVAVEADGTLVAGAAKSTAQAHRDASSLNVPMADLSAALKTGTKPPQSRRGDTGAAGGSWLARTLQNASPARLGVVAGILFTAIVGLIVALVVILSRAGR